MVNITGEYTVFFSEKLENKARMMDQFTFWKFDRSSQRLAHAKSKKKQEKYTIIYARK